VVLDVRWAAEGGGQGHDENVLVEVGAEDNHPDLNAALGGLGVGETRQARLAYAADHAGAFAGQTVSYTVTLKAVKTKVVPAADDEFARDLDFESLEELRAATRRRLEAAEEKAVDREVKNALLELLVQRASFEVPEALVARHMTARAEGAARGLALRGIDPRRAGVDWGDYRESQREAAILAARADVLLDEVARREGLEVSEAELEAEVTRLAEKLRRPREGLRARMQKEGDLGALRARIREEKTLDLLKANARLTFE
jgi:trigger factor